MSVFVCVVGGGAAGLMAAGIAAHQGAKVVLLERNNLPGRKLAITGKGRCNVTNVANRDEFMLNLPGNGQFLFSCMVQLSPQNTIRMFKDLGVALKVERGGRVFPETDDAEEVVSALVRHALEGGATIRPNSRVSTVRAIQGAGGFEVTCHDGSGLTCERLIVATGGASYTGTGSTGDGYRIAASLGHTVVPPSPALVPLVSNVAWVREAQGLSLKNVQVSLNRESRSLQSEFGEMLFTHFGLSGPIILTLSRRVTEESRKGLELRGLYISIDLKPALTADQLDERVKRDFAAFSRKLFRNCLDELLPSKLIAPMVALSGIPSDKPVNQVTREERSALVALLKAVRIPIVGTRPLEEAIVTAGGVSVKEVNPKTMESRLVPGLYFAGELLDVDGYTGGFNLQAAWSTGYVAGWSAAEEALMRR